MSSALPAPSAPSRTERVEMVHAMCASVDAGDVEGFASWFAPDAVYRFGNSEPTVGVEAVAAATRGAVTSLPWVRHTVDQVAEIDDQLFCRFTIETVDRAGRPVAMPCVTVITMSGGDPDRIVDYRVHMDLTPAFA